MATGYISDDVVAASPVPPLASGGEGGQEKLPPRLLPHPRPEFQPSSLAWEVREAFGFF